MKIKIKTNLWTGPLCVAVAVVAWFLIYDQIPELAQDSITVNARLFPQIFAVLIGALGMLLIFLSLVLHREAIREVTVTEELRVLAYFAIIALFCALISLIGFLPAALLFAAGSLAYFGDRNVWHYAAVIVAVLVVYFGFSYGLNVKF